MDFSHNTAYMCCFFVNFYFVLFLPCRPCNKVCRPCRRPVDRPVNRVENRELRVIHRAYIVQKVRFYPIHRVILPVHDCRFFAHFWKIYRIVHSLYPCTGTMSVVTAPLTQNHSQ